MPVCSLLVRRSPAVWGDHVAAASSTSHHQPPLFNVCDRPTNRSGSRPTTLPPPARSNVSRKGCFERDDAIVGHRVVLSIKAVRSARQSQELHPSVAVGHLIVSAGARGPMVGGHCEPGHVLSCAVDRLMMSVASYEIRRRGRRDGDWMMEG